MSTEASQQTAKYKDKIYILILSIVSLLFIGCISLLAYKSYYYVNHQPPGPDELNLIDQIALWFDPIFFQYNLALLSLSVTIIPLITFCYIQNMKNEKRRRLHRELPAKLLDDPSVKKYIEQYINKSFHIHHYLGSMLVLSLVVIMGSMIILLLKPLPLNAADGVTGVDYSLGANFLMLGTYMGSYILGDEKLYIHVISTTLTAFQFGFLGAYIYFIGHLVRSYFTLDLTPNMFVSSSVRMITGALLALVLCYIIVDPENKDSVLLQGLPVWSFFIGFFPSRGLLFLEKISIKTIGFAKVRYFSTPLSNLPGMSYAHQIRLAREGYDNIENLANASALDLALRTGFTYPQLNQWISQAKLHEYLRNDYQSFLQDTGISSMDELKAYFKSYSKDKSADPVSLLAAAGNQYEQKISILYRLVNTS
ncbi:MAG: hypothetical protein HPY30_15740 [Gammaproteobacteria bacterium (ex Lamellibrachia satsuma)]|nr:MAG: hypothetical protein HPY30_15740 [Gammaproteobacteria bacterium (ex Lamellibrachia satsuma)]